MSSGAEFDEIYRSADDYSDVPWARLAPSAELRRWLDHDTHTGGRAIVVGCGLGDDAELVAARGWEVTAFDVSEAAIRGCRERFPDSAVDYQVAELPDLPPQWKAAFDLVVESRTVQSMTPDERAEVAAAITGCVAPGGILFVHALCRDADTPLTDRPWPLAPSEFAYFTTAEPDWRHESSSPSGQPSLTLVWHDPVPPGIVRAPRVEGSWWRRPEYPRSSGYDPDWLLQLDMGPNPLWLLEELLGDLEIRPGDKVLDLGSGLGATSVFLAQEFGAEVWATDLWVSEDEAAAVVREAGVADRVHVVHADARRLPYSPGRFDAVISIDAFEYFGTDDQFLPYLAEFVRPEGTLAIATPCLRTEFASFDDIPAHITDTMGWEVAAWHTPQWWASHWARTGLVGEVTAWAGERAAEDWLTWATALPEAADAHERAVIDVLRTDLAAARQISFAFVTATLRADAAQRARML